MLLLIDGWRSPYSSWDFGSSFSAAAAGAPLDRLYAPLVQATNLVGYSVYPVDLPGSQPAVLRSVGFGGSGAPSASFAGMFGDYVQFVGGFGDSPERRFHDLLQVLADETGGLPMINARSDEALAAAREDTRTWYWLGFEPQRNEDDRLHAVRVRLPGHPELGVRTRRNYLDMSRETEVSMLVEGALLLGGTPGTDALEVSFGTPRKSGFRKLIVPMKVSVPLDDVELLPVDGQWMTELEFQFSLIDLFGDVATPPVRKVPVAIPKEPIPGDLLTFETELQIRKRSHRYVATVRDPLSGQILSARGDVGPR